jgi:hypothetical protein
MVSFWPARLGSLLTVTLLRLAVLRLLALFRGFVQGVTARFEGRDRGVAAGDSRARVDAGWVGLEGAVRTILDDAGDSRVLAVGSACTCGSSQIVAQRQPAPYVKREMLSRKRGFVTRGLWKSLWETEQTLESEQKGTEINSH